MLRVQIRWKIFSIALLVLMAHFGFVGFSQAALESLGVPVPGEAVPSTNMWAAGNLLYGESNGPFFVYNTVTQKVIYSGNADINNVQRNIMVDNDGNAYFGVNTNRLAKYSPVTNTVRVLSHILPNFLRASTRESSSGWIYGATGQNAPTDIFRYNPKQDIFQTLGSSWGYTAHMVLDPNERYVYYIPDAHGASYLKGTPVLQYDVVARTHKVIAFLDNVYRPKGYYLGGSYAFDMDEKGNLYINMNADKVGFDGNLDGFGVPVMVVVHIPDSERCVAVACPKTPRAQFRDVASEVGIDGSPGLPLYNSYIHTSSWGDVDNDGWIDLFAGTFFESPTVVKDKLLLNQNGKFVDSGQTALNIAGRASGSVFADFDNDGDLDLFISNNRQPSATSAVSDEFSHILRNDKGIFIDVTAGSGVSVQATGGRQVGVLDYNNDGLLDLFIVADNIRANGNTVLLKNNGNFRFTDVTAAAGILSGIHGLGLAIGDLTGNGWPDIFIAGWSGSSSTGPQDNFLLVANGNGTYHSIQGGVFDWSSFVKPGGEDWMAGASMADLNRDGKLDLVVSHHFGSSEDANVPRKIRVYMNRGNDESGNPIFADITDTAGIPSFVSKQPHVEIQDFDNDGWPDLYVSVAVDTPSGKAPLIYLHNGNSGDPTFSLAPNIPSINNPLYTAGGPTADFNRDGKLDIFMNEFRSVCAGTGAACDLGGVVPSKLFQNTGAPGNWLQVKYNDGTNTMGVGAKVKIYKQGTKQLLAFREISPSSGWSSSQPAIAHFGLGNETFVDVVVEMPFGGTVYRTNSVPANRMIVMPNPVLETTAHQGLEASVVSDTSASFIAEPGVSLPAHTTAKAVPIVDFVPYPTGYAGRLWSQWGAGYFASNGKFYSAIGDHASPDGNAFLYEYDPITKKIKSVGDIQTATNHVAGQPGHGKIHSQINEGQDGYIYMTGYRGSTVSWEPSVLLRYPINTVAAASAGSLPSPTPVDSSPTIILTSPASGSTGKGTITVQATASDDKGVTRVEFFIDGASIGVDTTSSYSVLWDSSTVADGVHIISATATDTIGQAKSASVSVTVANVPPSLTTLTVSPSSASVQPGNTKQFAAQGFDQFGSAMTITSVWFVSGGGTIDKTGLLTAGRVEGSFTVTAAVGGVSGTATVTISTSNRVLDGLVALYDFSEGAGAVVHDTSGVGVPLDLNILDGTKVKWLSGGNGVEFIAAGSGIKSPSGVIKIHSALTATNRLTMEAWVTPSNLTQSGPSRIVTISGGTSSGQVNLHLGQETSSASFRLRTTANTFSWTTVPNVFKDTLNPRHVVITYDGLVKRMFVDGVLQPTTASLSGDFSNWDPNHPLVIGNEATLDRSYLGKVFLTAIYDRALTDTEIQQNFQAGINGVSTPTPTPTPIPTPIPTPTPTPTPTPVPGTFPGWGVIASIYYDVVQDDPANLYLAEAASELKTYISKTGKTLSITATQSGSPAIVLKVDPVWPELAGMNEEAFKLFVNSSGIFIIGKSPIAVRHGAYALLEKLGYRWFFHSPIWKVAPDSLISLEGLNEVQEPDFIYRRIWGSFQDMPQRAAWDGWQEWNRLYGPKTYTVQHSYSSIIPSSEAAAHPDWFCYNAAGNPKQLNVDNPEVLQKAKDYAINYLKNNPNAGSVPVSPNDGPGWDSCYDPNNLQLITDKVFNFSNEVAKAVKVAFPGEEKYVGVYSYAAYSCVPTIPLESNLLAQIATAYGYCGTSVEARLGGIADRGATIAIRDYYDVWVWSHDQPGRMEGSFAAIPFYTNNNVNVMNAESGDGWGAKGILYYVMSKLYWEPNADPLVILDDFYEKAFGPAKVLIQNYYNLWYSDNTVTDNKLGLAFKYLDEAETLAAGNAEILNRIRFLEYYMRYVWQWREKDSMDQTQLTDFYKDMCSISDWSVVWFKYIRTAEKPEDLAAILINTYGMTQANLDAVCDRTLPSAEKAGVWLSEGLAAFPNPIEAPDIDITGMSLVPFGETALPKLPTVLSKDVRPILIPAKARETITVKELWYCRGGNIVWKDSQGVVLETIDTRDGSCVRDVQFNAPKDDTYQLSCSDQCNMDVVSHGASYLVKPGMNKRLLGAGSMYFYVPEGSAGLIIGAKPYADTYITTVKLYDDTDSLQLNKSCTGGGACEWGMTNPSPGVWRVDYGGTYGGEGTYLWLRGVPPLMWHDPQYLLIPSSSPPPSLPISSGGGFSLFSLPRHYLFQDEDNTLEVQGASFDTTKTFTIKFFQAEVEQKSISVIPADSATLRTTLSVADLSSLSPGLYDMAVESTLDSTTKTYSTKIAITKRGDLWSQGATDSSLQKRDGKVDIYDVSRMLSKWGSTQATDLQEADINAGPNNVSQGAIDLYDANLMMRNWSG